jgi:hypothetical protein
VELSSCDSLTCRSSDSSIHEWAVSSGTHGKGVILESNLVERMVLISGAWRLGCDATDIMPPSLQLSIVIVVYDQQGLWKL